MKNTISTLKLALAWWENKTSDKKLELHAKYFINMTGMLTDTQITEIFVQETANIDKTDIESAYLMQIQNKPIETQVEKVFCETSFVHYIEDFSFDDKIKMIEMLMRNSGINNCVVSSQGLGFIHNLY